MAKIKWGEKKTFHSGIDRGVIYPIDRPAQPWDGLVSVDEGGSQERSTYYVDGRKYLTVVTPRDYEAKITCITFPPILESLCGIVEAADGLFLDSQQPEPFNLSYRTMINGGESYRIHLIYGITAEFGGAGYSTHSDEMDPTEFEFDIEATPQSISGYRPTAHIMIDSTHINPNVMTFIELALYGGDNNEPAIPAIQDLYEFMNFGEVIVIRDPGDGTFEIEGSYKYVKTNMDGSFEVTNLLDEQVVFNPGGQDGYYDLVVTT